MSNLTDTAALSIGNVSSNLNSTLMFCACPNTTSANAKAKLETSDAFVYIIVVLSFYATSMVLLMIKYIRREEEELSLDYYYTEFVKRDRFQSARFRNQMALEKANKNAVLMKTLEFFRGNRYLTVDEKKRFMKTARNKSSGSTMDTKNIQIVRISTENEQEMETMV